MSGRGVVERNRAVAERTRAVALCEHARDLRQRSALLAGGLVESLARSEPPVGHQGDLFALRLPRLPVTLGLVRRNFAKWLERHWVPREDASDITLAFSEACANAMEHPRSPERPAVEIAAWASASEVEIVVRDFGRWGGDGSRANESRGRGLDMIRALMDEVVVVEGDDGTRITMRRRFGADGLSVSR